MPIMNVIKNDAYGNMLCAKIPCEDFNIGSQLIVAEYEEALFVKDGVIEEIFGPGKYTLTTENYPFLTKLMSHLFTGGVSAYNCKVYYINKYKPRFNKLNKKNDSLTIVLEEKEWKTYQILKTYTKTEYKLDWLGYILLIALVYAVIQFIIMYVR